MRNIFKYWTSPAEALLFIVFVLLLIGCINIFSASFVLAGHLLNDSYYFLKRHLFACAVGLSWMVVAAWPDYRKFIHRHWIFIAGIIALLIAVLYIGIDANGARRWIRIGIKFQPSELAKLVVIILTASFLGTKLERHRKISLKSWPLGVAIVIGFLVMRQPDMGTAVVIVGLCILMYLLAGIPQREVLTMLFFGIMAVTFFSFAAPYRAERIHAWLDPWAYQQTGGYQTVQSLLAIGSGGFLGTGFGMGASKFYYLPEAHTDFAFAVLCQEMGFLGALLVILLFSGLCILGIRIAMQAPDSAGTMLASGLTALIVGQAIGNIAMVVGAIPVTGVPLPFISYGGTSLIVNLSAIGLLLNISRQSALNNDDSVSKPAKTVKHRLQRVK